MNFNRVGIDSAIRRKWCPAVVAFSKARGRLTSVQQETKAELVINLKTAKARSAGDAARHCRQYDRINHCNPTSFAAVARHSKRLSWEGGGGRSGGTRSGCRLGECLGPAKRQRGRKTPNAGRSWKALRIFMLLLSAKSSRRQPGL